jgi:hypothetical protein
MNMQTTKKVIRVRKTNNLSKAVGRHWTLTRVVGDVRGDFAFAIDDEGHSAFIPRPIVRRHNITPADEGAGFTAPTREAAELGGDPQIILPVVWDGEAEEEEVETTIPDRDYDAEIDVLCEKISDATGSITAIDALIEKAKDLEREASNMRNVATMLHNEFTGLLDWLNNTYPEGDE